MSILTTFRLADNQGNHLIELANYSSYSYVLNCAPGNVGVLELELPRSFNTSLLMRDGRIGPWRSINGRAPYHDNGAIYLIETIRYRATSTFVRASHATGLLDRRIIAYAAGSSYATKSVAAADNQIKAFWKENAGASISGVDRDGVETQADISAYVATQANVSQGASVAKAAARRRLLAVAQELAEASTTAGTYLTFEIIAPSESTLELRTYATQRGVDRRAGTANPVILREQAGVLENAELEIDWRNEKTFVIAGGQGEGTARLIATSLDTTRMGASPFGRNETFLDMSNVADSTSLLDDADSGLRQLRPVVTFSGDLIETPELTRGLQFDLGDMLTAEDPQTRQQYDVRLDVITETMNSQGRKSEIKLRSVTMSDPYQQRDIARRLEQSQVAERPFLGYGTAFPTAPATSRTFFRTDLGFAFFYDGTRWLSTHEYESSIGIATTTVTAQLSRRPIRSDYSIYVTYIVVNYRVTAPNNGTNFWTIQIRGVDSSNASTTTIDSFTTAASAAGTWITVERAPNTQAIPANRNVLDLAALITLAPGALDVQSAVYYRLIAT